MDFVTCQNCDDLLELATSCDRLGGSRSFKGGLGGLTFLIRRVFTPIGTSLISAGQLTYHRFDFGLGIL